MELLVTHLMVNACVIEVGLVLIAIKNVLLIDMDKIVAKNAAVEMVEAVITFLANAIVLQVIQDLCKTLFILLLILLNIKIQILNYSNIILFLVVMICVHRENMAMNVSQNVNVKMVVPAILQLANVTVLLDGL